MFRIIILAVCVSFAPAVFGAISRMVCEHRTMSIVCGSGQTISIVSATYGRSEGESCSDLGPIKTTECSSTTAQDTALVAAKCNGQNSCDVEASNGVFKDPCVGTFKYLNVEYECSAQIIESMVCEHRTMSIVCGSGQAISIVSATYGRSEGEFCSDLGPIKTTECSSTTAQDTALVAAQCNGQNSCDVEASNSVFKDPCYGTFKYLVVEHTCSAQSVPTWGAWSSYSKWTACSRDCRQSRTRTRQCNSLSNNGYAISCEGSAIETSAQRCYSGLCLDEACKAQVSTFAAIPGKCGSFLRCVPKFEPILMDCAPGTYWNQTLLTCVHISESSCVNDAGIDAGSGGVE